MGDCIFCKIVRNEIPAVKLYENEKAVAFLDANPNNHGHTLVIPKEHFRNIFDISDDAMIGVATLLKKLATAVKDGMEAEGINIAMNNEPVAGQVVFHAHIHIIPRHKDDGLKIWSTKRPYGAGEMDETAQKIKAHL